MTIQSDKYICYKEDKDTTTLIKWIDLNNN